jgi:hypothetical protein
MRIEPAYLTATMIKIVHIAAEIAPSTFSGVGATAAEPKKIWSIA